MSRSRRGARGWLALGFSVCTAYLMVLPPQTVRASCLTAVRQGGEKATAADRLREQLLFVPEVGPTGAGECDGFSSTPFGVKRCSVL